MKQLVSRARFDAISDGIFAIAMTIMVLEIKLPHLDGSASTGDIQHYIDTTMPTLIIFMVSFMVLANLWTSHGRLPISKDGVPRRIAMANFHFLLFVCLVPFATALINEVGMHVISVQVFSVILAGATLLLGRLRYKMYTYEHVDKEELKNLRFRIILALIASIIGINITFLGQWWQPALIIGYACVIIAPLAFRVRQPKES